jgi:ABC-2 type transport system permease protein
MKKFMNLFKKDIKELVTIQLILPLIIMIAIYGFLGTLVKSETKKAMAPQNVVIVDMDKSAFSNSLIETMKQGNLIPVQSQSDNIEISLNVAKEKNIKVVIVIPDGFGQDVLSFKQPEIQVYSVMNSFSIMSMGQPSVVKGIIQTINDSISSQFIGEKFTGIPPEIVKSPIKTKDFVMVNGKVAAISPDIVSQAFASQNLIIPIVLAFVIIFSAQMLASLIALEKQNKTLETLLTVPIKRSLIVFSKMLSVGVVALIISVVYLIAMNSYMSGITGGSIGFGNNNVSAVLKQVGMNFTPLTYSLLGLSIFFAILAALSVTTILAVYAEDLKDVQAMLDPLMIFILIPYFLTLFTDPANLSLPLKLILYAIPFSHPFLATQNLMFGRFSPVILGIIYQILFSFVCIMIASKIFSSDRILTARVKFRKRLLSK